MCSASAFIEIESNLMNEPSTPDAKPVAPMRRRVFATVAVWLYAAPLLGIAGTLFGMSRAYRTLAQPGGATPEALAGDIGFAMVSTAIGLGLGFVGLVMVLINLRVYKDRDRGFGMSCLIGSIIWCWVAFPYGAVVGLPMVVYALWMRCTTKDADE